MKLKHYLKQIRIKANLTQAEAADKLGMTSAQYISNVERGVKMSPVMYMRLIRLYKAPLWASRKVYLAGVGRLLR